MILSTKSPSAILNILNQGPRLTVEATQDMPNLNMPNLNEAYLVVHAAMARAFAGAWLIKSKSDDASLAASLTEVVRQPLRAGEIGRSVPL